MKYLEKRRTARWIPFTGIILGILMIISSTRLSDMGVGSYVVDNPKANRSLTLNPDGIAFMGGVFVILGLGALIYGLFVNDYSKTEAAKPVEAASFDVPDNYQRMSVLIEKSQECGVPRKKAGQVYHLMEDKDYGAAFSRLLMLIDEYEIQLSEESYNEFVATAKMLHLPHSYCEMLKAIK
ncbi:hypothetical protein [Chitinophaga sp. Cy-1792]|uniref:hypothetical protein n=1 Tax=Chitinophaga sp. Cy-1792 TaxID=2608339 RepID=UPI00142397D7|nr:hypothetical protein [Chitinophaga sp. Cy-1792]NIG55264.1 hypothetical protein [Chitinophaga sp. Cy-1792]